MPVAADPSTAAVNTMNRRLMLNKTVLSDPMVVICGCQTQTLRRKAK